MSRESKRAQISLARIQQPPESMLDPTTLMLKQLVANALLMDDVLIHITELLAKRTKAEIAAKSFLLMIDMSGVRDRLAQYGVPESAAPFHIKLHSLEWLGSSDAKGMVGDGVAARANVVHLLNTAAKDPEDTVVLLYVKPDPLKPVMVFTTRLLSAAIHAIYSNGVCTCLKKCLFAKLDVQKLRSAWAKLSYEQKFNAIAVLVSLPLSSFLPEGLNRDEVRLAKVMQRVMNTCHHCHQHETAEAKLKLCTGCNVYSYCSRKCQKADWLEHKPECRRTAKAFTPALAKTFRELLAIMWHPQMRKDLSVEYEKAAERTRTRQLQCHVYFRDEQAIKAFKREFEEKGRVNLDGRVVKELEMDSRDWRVFIRTAADLRDMDDVFSAENVEALPANHFVLVLEVGANGAGKSAVWPQIGQVRSCPLGDEEAERRDALAAARETSTDKQASKKSDQ